MLNKESGQSSWERIGRNSLYRGAYFTTISTIPFTIGLVLETVSPNLIEGTLDEAMQIIPRIMAAGFLTGFVISGMTELVETHGRRLAREVLERTRKFRDNKKLFFN